MQEVLILQYGRTLSFVAIREALSRIIDDLKRIAV